MQPVQEDGGVAYAALRHTHLRQFLFCFGAFASMYSNGARGVFARVVAGYEHFIGFVLMTPPVGIAGGSATVDGLAPVSQTHRPPALFVVFPTTMSCKAPFNASSNGRNA